MEGGIVKYEIDAGKLNYVAEFRASRQGDSTRLTAIVTFHAHLGPLERLLPGLVIKGLSSLVLPDEVLRNVRRGLTVEGRVAGRY